MKPMIAVVEPASSGLDLLDAAARLGFGTVVVSHDADDRALAPHVRDLADRVVRIDTNDVDALQDTLAGLARQHALGGIVPGFEYYVESTNRINAHLGLPGLPAASVACVRNKHRMRLRLAEHGIRMPRFALVTSQDELFEAAARVGYPAVLKPDDGSGSVMVQRVDNRSELLAAYRRILADDTLDLGRRFGARLLLEEYIRGPELSVEGYLSSEGVEIVSITQKLLGPEPNFVEMGHIVEAKVDADARQTIHDYVRGVVSALGLSMGVFHCELRQSADGPVLIEIAARLAGDRICRLIELAKGISLSELMIKAYVGLPLPPQPMEDRGHAGVVFLSAPPSMRVFHGFEGIDGLRQQVPGVEEIALYATPGAYISPLTDCRGRLGHVIVTGRTHDQVRDRFAMIESLVAVRGEALSGAA